MFHSKPFKKDLTPFAKGGKVVKHVGKGAREQSSHGSGGEPMTGGNPYARMANMYPKPSDMAPSGAGLGGPPMDQQTAPPVPQGQRPPSAPTAMMPGGDETMSSGGDEEE